jgi:uncharacterized protein
MSPLLASAELLLFRRRAWFLGGFILLTLGMAWSASKIRVDASFNKSLPAAHPYIQTFIQYQSEFGGANRVIVALVARQGDIFTPEFFAALKAATDEVFFLPGVDRAQVQSLFTPNVRYIEVVEDGLAGGAVVPDGFEPDAEGFAKVRENLVKSGRIGQLVANDFSGAIINAQLLEVDPTTGRKLDYQQIAEALESRVRARFENEAHTVHIIGFAKVMGDVAAGARGVLTFFVVSLLMTTLLVWHYAGRWKLAAAPIVCSIVAVVWQLGTLNFLGFGIDPLSILVPFLVFAIGVSHGLQMVRAYRTEVFSGKAGVGAARNAFRQLLVPGGLALATDTIGFITMLVIDIETVRELAITASLGVGVIIITNLFLLPLVLSYVPLSTSYAAWIANRRVRTDRFWATFAAEMKPIPSLVIILVFLAAGIIGWREARGIQIGDLHAGVPELHQDSRYNQDTREVVSRFSIGVDLLTVITESVPNGCVDHEVVALIDRFCGHLLELPGVQSVISLTSVAKGVNAAWNEGSLKWRILPRDPRALAQAVSPIETATGLLNSDGSVMPVMVFLRDHKAETLRSVTAAVSAFAAENPSSKVRFRLASGNAGVMAATNDVVAAAQFPILLWVFGAVIVLCLIVFRSIRAVLCIVLPLAVVSYLAYALMVRLEIGLKTSTLPVVALGVGIGVDYGIYIFAVLQKNLRHGVLFEDAMFVAFKETGSAVVFTGLSLGLGVSLWIFSDLKFQADMGILLTFMFLLNMLAAIVLLPAMARWLYEHRQFKRRESE